MQCMQGLRLTEEVCLRMLHYLVGHVVVSGSQKVLCALVCVLWEVCVVLKHNSLCGDAAAFCQHNCLVALMLQACMKCDGCRLCNCLYNHARRGVVAGMLVFVRRFRASLVHRYARAFVSPFSWLRLAVGIVGRARWRWQWR